MSLVSAVILLLLVMDPLGAIPVFLAALKNTEETKHIRIIVRECLVAFIALLVFMVFGKQVLELLQLSETSLEIAGGIILFLIAVRIIFPTPHGVFGDLPHDEPYIVPLAIPTIAGPSAIATVILLVSRWPEKVGTWILALTIALCVSTIVLACGNRIGKMLGERGMLAFERLMGLILTAVAVQMFLNGVRDFVHRL